MVRNFTALTYCLSLGVFMMTTVSANAATFTLSDPAARRGAPIAQNFLEMHGDNVSLLGTPNGLSCVASQPLRISESVYLAPDGTEVPFSEVTRSPASSIQAITRPDATVAFRVQLKYSPDPEKPIMMQIGERMFSIATALESSGDSLWITGKMSLMLAEALRRGDSPSLQAESAGTGRQITDQINSPDMAGLDACLVTLQQLLDAKNTPKMEMSDLDMPDVNRRQADAPVPAAIDSIVPERGDLLASVNVGPFEPVWPVPVASLRLKFVARADPKTRVAPSALEGCRMRNIPDNLFLGRLTAVTGFFSQTQDVYVAFDNEGKLQRAYIPGIFDSDLTTGAKRVRVSLAADSNLPDQPNQVSGCLGDALQEVPVCAFSNEDVDGYTLAECGALGIPETREDFLDSLLEPTYFGVDTLEPPLISSDPPSLPGFSGWEVPRVGDTLPFSFVDDSLTTFPGGNVRPNSGGGQEVSPVPLPAAIWLMMSGLIAMFGLGVLQRRNVHA